MSDCKSCKYSQIALVSRCENELLSLLICSDDTCEHYLEEVPIDGECENWVYCPGALE